MNNDETNLIPTESVSLSTTATETDLTLNKTELNTQALEIINQVIAETDQQKVKDLTSLFNMNQNKKTMIRVNKLNDLLDTITDRAIARFEQRPDEISNQELLQGIKVVQDALDKSNKQINGMTETPLIQINQQNNELNLGDTPGSLTKESRDKVRNAVASILSGLTQNSRNVGQDTIIETTTPEDIIEEPKNEN